MGASPFRWAVWIAHLIPICLLPSALWRIAMVVGVPVGFSAQELREDYDLPGWNGAVFILGLVVVLELLGLLSLGLVQGWGEVFPRWFPFVGGKRVPILFAAIPASLGALLISLVTFSQLAVWPSTDHTRFPLVGVAYAPVLAWGPLLGIITVAYVERRRRSERPPQR